MLSRVVVTGYGILSSIGQNSQEFTSSLIMGCSGISHLKQKFEPPISVNIGAEIKDFQFLSALENFASLPNELIEQAKRSAQRAPFTIQTSVISALEAWQQSQLYYHHIDRYRIGIVVAGQNSTQNYQYGLSSGFQKNPEYLSPRYALHFMDTDQVGTLSEIFGIQGEGLSVGGASASGNVAIIKGLQAIQLDLIDICLVIGVVADLSPMDLQGFFNIGAMGGKLFQGKPEKACRPFDTQHEGFIYGQASGCLILESEASAIARDAPIEAEILGGALTLDGNRLSDPSVEGESGAMRSALLKSGISARQIDYINAHGSSSPIGDDAEIEAIRRVFTEHLPGIRINSTKGLTGHCLFSAGVIEAIATIVQLGNDFLHPNLNLETPIDSQCNFCGSSAVKGVFTTALSNSFGFGGINTSLVIKKGPDQMETCGFAVI